MSTEFSTDFTALGSEPNRQGAPPPRGISIKRLLRLRLPLMAVVAIAVAVPGIAAVWYLSPTQYSARTQIRYAVTGQGILEDARGPSGREYDQFLATEVRMIEGPTVLLPVLNDPAVREMAWLMESDDPLVALSNRLTVMRVPNSDLIAITVHAPSRADALALAGRIEDVYMRYALGREQELGGARLTALYTQRDQFQGEVSRLTEQLRSMRRAIDTPMIDSLGRVAVSPHRDQYSQAQSDVIRASNEVRQREALLEQLQGLQERFRGNPSAAVHEMDIEIGVSNNPRVAALANAVAAAEKEIAVLETSYQPDSPQLRVPKRNLEASRSELRQAEIEARRKLLEARISQVRFQLADAQRNLDDAQERMDTFAGLITGDEERELRLAQELEEIRSVERDRDLAQNRLDAISTHIENIQLESQAPASVQRTGMPIAPSAPDHGRRNRLLLAVLAAAAAAGASIGLLREITDQQVRTPLDVGYATPLPVLASVPHAVTERRSNGRPLPLLTADDPTSVGANEFRRILARVIYPPEGASELSTCLVASPSRGDGKTSIACNLAIALAQANRRVLLIDICSRKPQVEPSFGLDPAEGLGEVLLGEASPNDLVRSTSIENLFLLGPGLRGDALVGKLASRDIVEFLERAEEAFEHVIIDTPPGLLMSDAKLIAPIVDGVFMVCGAGVTTLGMLRRCVSEFQLIGANLVGVVLNGVRPHVGGYMARNLKLYYDDTATRGGQGPAANGKHSPETPEDYPMIVLVDDDEAKDQNAADAVTDEESVLDTDEIIVEHEKSTAETPR